MLMSEPRGHADMYGALLVESDLPEADMAVLFMHNEGKDQPHNACLCLLLLLVQLMMDGYLIVQLIMDR